MIGLLHNKDDEDNELIPPEFRRITKALLYMSLENEYLLPPKESKGVNKAYLVGVATNTVFRINMMDFRRFEIGLLPRHWRKQLWINLAIIYRKLTVMLRERNHLQMGFQDNCIPDEGWLLKVIRYCDQENIMEVFLESCPNPAIINCYSRPVHVAKIGAQQYLFGDHEALRTNKIISMLRDINDVGRKLKNRRADVEELVRQQQRLQVKIGQDEASLRSLLTNVSMQLMNLGGQVNEDEIFIQGDMPQRNRANL